MRVLNAARVGTNVPGTVYVGRPGKWGNPFVLGQDGDRAEVIEKYAEWIKTQHQLLLALPELAGKDLVCWCAPLPCHGEVLVQLIEDRFIKEKR